MSSNAIVEKLDEAIARASEFQSMTVDGDQTVNPNIGTLMRAREQLQQEEARKTRGTFISFDLSKQDF
jgi:hypothetical protein